MVLSILRRSLAVPPTTINSTFILGAKKLVFEYCETWGSNEGMKKFILNDMVGVAERYPGVEMVVRRVDHRHPHLRGLYVNGRDKVICVRSLAPPAILKKVQLLLDSSGHKIVSLKRPKVESTTESVRGIWSAFHEDVAGR